MDDNIAHNINNKDPTRNDGFALSVNAATPSSSLLTSDAHEQTTTTTTDAKSTKPSLPVKKSFKSVSINTMFRSLASGASGDSKLDPSHHLISAGGIGRSSSGSSISAATSNSPSTTGNGHNASSSSSSSIFPKVTTLHSGLKIAPMKRDDSQSPRPKSSSTGDDHHHFDGTSASFDRNGTPLSNTTQHTVWNRNGISSASKVTPFNTSSNKNTSGDKQHNAPPKVFTEQELEKLGIRLVQRMDEHKLSDLGWDEMDDDDDADWADTLEFDDGTKVVFKHDDAAAQQDGQINNNNNTPAATTTLTSPPVIATRPIKSSSIAASTLEKNQHPQLSPQSSDASRPVWGAIKPPVKPPQFTISPSPDYQPESSSSSSLLLSNDARNRQPHPPQQSLSPDDDNNNNNHHHPRRLPTHDFDRYYGGHARPPVRGELYNDRSGQFEPVARRSSKQQQPTTAPAATIPSPQAILKNSTTADTQEPPPPSQPVEESSSSSSSSPQLTASEIPSVAPLSPNELAKQQDQVMKRARENARRRKEEEQQRERERLESSRKRAEALAKLERERIEADHNNNNNNGKKTILQQGASDQLPKRIKTRDNDVDDGFSIPKVSSAEELEHPQQVKNNPTTIQDEGDKSITNTKSTGNDIDSIKNTSSIWLFSYDSRNSRDNWEADKNHNSLVQESNTTPSSHVWGPIGSNKQQQQQQQHNRARGAKDEGNEPHRNQLGSILTRDSWRRGGQQSSKHPRQYPVPPAPPIVSTAPSIAVSSVFDSTTTTAAHSDDAINLEDHTPPSSSSSSVPQQPSPGSSRSSSRFFPSPALKQQSQGEGFSHRPSSTLSRNTSDSTNTIVASDGWDRATGSNTSGGGMPTNQRYPASPSAKNHSTGNLDKLNTRMPNIGSIETLQNMITDRLSSESNNNNNTNASSSSGGGNQDDVLPQQTRKSLSGAGAVGDTMMDVSTMPPVDSIRGFLMSDGDHVVRNSTTTPAYRVPVGVGRTSSASEINQVVVSSSSAKNRKFETTVGAQRLVVPTPPVSFASIVSAANNGKPRIHDDDENLPKDRLAVCSSITPIVEDDDDEKIKINLGNYSNLVRTIAQRFVSIEKLDNYVVEKLIAPPGGYPRWVSTNTHFDPNRFIYDTPSYRVFLKHDVPAKIVYGKARDLSDKVLSNGEVIISTAHRRRQRQTSTTTTSASASRNGKRPTSSHNNKNSNSTSKPGDFTTTTSSSSNNKSTSSGSKRSSVRGGRQQQQRKSATVSV